MWKAAQLGLTCIALTYLMCCSMFVRSKYSFGLSSDLEWLSRQSWAEFVALWQGELGALQSSDSRGDLLSVQHQDWDECMLFGCAVVKALPEASQHCAYLGRFTLLLEGYRSCPTCD